jgi:hypothetical protein
VVLGKGSGDAAETAGAVVEEDEVGFLRGHGEGGAKGVPGDVSSEHFVDFGRYGR